MNRNIFRTSVVIFCITVATGASGCFRAKLIWEETNPAPDTSTVSPGFAQSAGGGVSTSIPGNYRLVGSAGSPDLQGYSINAGGNLRLQGGLVAQ
ncbi:MAG: hypothetical protein JNL01_01385 [Bdellovibrionales bacterium]|nr:hypothetical protein [Bdellovibrionales bacterium]